MLAPGTGWRNILVGEVRVRASMIPKETPAPFQQSCRIPFSSPPIGRREGSTAIRRTNVDLPLTRENHRNDTVTKGSRCTVSPNDVTHTAYIRGRTRERSGAWVQSHE